MSSLGHIHIVTHSHNNIIICFYIIPTLHEWIISPVYSKNINELMSNILVYLYLLYEYKLSRNQSSHLVTLTTQQYIGTYSKK